MSEPIARRQFLSGALGLAVAGALARPASIGARRSAPTPTPTTIPSISASTPILVLCTLYGGNDGLNTVVPTSDPAYFLQRGNIAIEPGDLLQLGSGFGLNPALVGMKKMWDAGQAAIVRGVGYPNPSLSHFQSMDIWQSGSLKSDEVTGWLGRWIDRVKPDPLVALSVGPTVLPAMVGSHRQASALVDSNSASSQLPDGDAPFLAIYRQLQRELAAETALESAISQSGTNMLNVSRVAYDALATHAPPTYPAGVDAGDIGTQFGVVSQMIRAGVPTMAYAVTQGNYDTHAGEVSTQTENLKELDAAIAAFFSSLAGSPHGSSTIVAVYTEFGRRVESNASGGSDHGAANDVFVLGGLVKGGFYGDPPSLTDLDENGNLIYNVDYRSVFATLLENAVGFESKPVFGSNFPTLGFL